MVSVSSGRVVCRATVTQLTNTLSDVTPIVQLKF